MNHKWKEYENGAVRCTKCGQPDHITAAAERFRFALEQPWSRYPDATRAIEEYCEKNGVKYTAEFERAVRTVANRMKGEQTCGR